MTPPPTITTSAIVLVPLASAPAPDSAATSACRDDSSSLPWLWPSLPLLLCCSPSSVPCQQCTETPGRPGRGPELGRPSPMPCQQCTEAQRYDSCMAPEQTIDARTLYAAAGGAATFERIVERFYAGVANDPILRPLYPDD